MGLRSLRASSHEPRAWPCNQARGSWLKARGQKVAAPTFAPMLTMDSFHFKGRKALVRVDLNVPQDENGNVTDDTRARAIVPTVKKIVADGGSAILMSHLGRPKGKPNPAMSLKPVAKYLEG